MTSLQKFIRRDDGFIVVAVLWILAALATLASVYAVYVANTASSSRVNDDRIQAQGLVSAAVELTAYRLTALEQEVRPTRGAFSFRMGGGNVGVEFRSEAARIDLNEAPKELLAGLFSALGARPAEAGYFADRIVGWRTKSGEAGDQAAANETSMYRTAGISYSPRAAAFAHVGELWLVMGIPPQFVERALPYVTVFSGQSNVNVLDAAPLALAALPGMTPEVLNAVLIQRGAGRQNGEYVLGLLGPARGAATLDASKAMRVRVQVELPNGRAVNASVVILVLVGADEPFRVLSWRSDADGPIDDEPPGELPREPSRAGLR
jgi:general secretion pathway protein K